MSGPAKWSLPEKAPEPQKAEEPKKPRKTGSDTHTGTDPYGRAIGPKEDHTKPKLDAAGRTAKQGPAQATPGKDVPTDLSTTPEAPKDKAQG